MRYNDEEEPEVDESLCTEAQLREMHKSPVSKKWLIFWGVLLVAILICVVVIIVLSR